MPKTCIIGAGISGLALAWQLKRRGEDCCVLEAAGQAGGAMRSHAADGHLAEEGPNSILLNSAPIEEFLYSIPGLRERMVEANPAANKRYIVRNGRLHAVPSGPLSALTTPLWSLAGKLRVLREPFIGPAPAEREESVADFVRRRLGDELYRYAINPLVGGIYAGDPEQLSLRYGFPKLHALDQQHGGLIRGGIAKLRQARRQPGPKLRKRIISFQGGMAELPEKLAAALGPQLQTQVALQSIQQTPAGWQLAWQNADGAQQAVFERVILTLPAHQLARLPLPPELQAALAPLQAIEYPPVSVLSLGYPRSAVQHPLDGFGALVPECEGRNILGVLFPSSIFEGRAPSDQVLLSVFIGGKRQPELASADTQAVLASALPEVEALLGIRGAPSFVHHKHWPQAIPQYKLGYGQQLEQMAAIEQDFPGLQLAGNYRSGISVTYCLEAALAH